MTFTERLRSAKAGAGLSIEEMAIFFDGMSKQTMWSWLKGRVPKPYHADQAEQWLDRLERLLKRKSPLFPIPMSVRQGDRHSYVASIRKRYT